jgi:serine phosphatase RsbU (regulator of sigma subunit)
MEIVGQHLDNVFGKTLFLYTDGVNEAENPQQQQYGDDRLQQLLAAGKTASTRDTVHTVRHEVASFVDGAEPSDDMTMLCIKFL